MRKIILLTIICLLIAVPAFAGVTQFTLYPVKYPVLIEGSKLNSNLPILTYKANGGDNTYVPLRAVLDIMGATTEWDGTKANVITNRAYPEGIAFSCCMIKVYKNGKFVGNGSGVILDYDEIITASHVATEGDTFEIIYNFNGKTTAKLKKNIPGVDAALLEPVAKTRKSVKIGDSDEIMAGQKIIVISSPKGSLNTIGHGRVENDKIIANGVNTFQTTAKVEHGSSGGGVFNADGELIGIVSSGDKDYGFAVPINEIRKALVN